MFVAINFGDAPQTVTFSDAPFEGAYVEHFSGEGVAVGADFALDIEPRGYRVYVQ